MYIGKNNFLELQYVIGKVKKLFQLRKQFTAQISMWTLQNGYFNIHKYYSSYTHKMLSTDILEALDSKSLHNKTNVKYCKIDLIIIILEFRFLT